MESGDKSEVKQEKDVNKKSEIINEENSPAEKTPTKATPKRSARNIANCGKAKNVKPTNENTAEDSESAKEIETSDNNKSANDDEASESVESANQSGDSENIESANEDIEGADEDESTQNEDEASSAGPSGVISVSQKLKHACMHCPKSFARKKELTTHLYIHRENQNNDCTICGKNFTTATLLRRHNNAHHKPRTRNVRQYVCNHCAEVFSTQRQLEKHHIERHVTQKQFECNVCGATFSWAQNLKKHKQAHEVNPHRCKICFKEFVDQTSLRVHVLSNHKPPHRFGPTPMPTNQPRSFICSICGRGFQFDFSYRAHMEAHVIPAEGQAPPQFVGSGGAQNGSLPVDTPQYVTVDQEGIIDLGILSGGAGSVSMGSNSNEIVIEVYRDEPDSQQYPVMSEEVTQPPVSKRIKVEDGRVEQDIEDAEVEEEHYEGGSESIEEFKKSLELPKIANMSDSSKERQMFPRVNLDYKYIPVKNNVKKGKVHAQREPVPFLFDCVMTNEKPFGCGVCGMTFRWQISLDIHYREHVQAGSMCNTKVAKAEKKPAEKQIARKRGRPLGSGVRKGTKYTQLQEQSGTGEEWSQESSEVIESNIVHKQVASDDEETCDMESEDAGNDAVQVVSSMQVVASTGLAQNIQQQARTQTQTAPLDSDSFILPKMVLSSDIMNMVKSGSTDNLMKAESALAVEPGDKPTATRSPLFVNIKDSEAIVKWQAVMRWSRCGAWVCHMPSCGKIFSTNHSLTKHRISKHPGASRPCEDCPTNVRYLSDVTLSIHRRQTHKQHKLYCLHCGKGFRVGADLCRHRRLHVGGKEVRKRLMGFEGVGSKRNKCFVCGKRYFLKNSLENHSKEHSVDFDVSGVPNTAANEGSIVNTDSGPNGSIDGANVHNSLRCSSCSKQFRTQEGYVFHQKQCNSSGSAVAMAHV